MPVLFCTLLRPIDNPNNNAQAFIDTLETDLAPIFSDEFFDPIIDGVSLQGEVVSEEIFGPSPPLPPSPVFPPMPPKTDTEPPVIQVLGKIFKKNNQIPQCSLYEDAVGCLLFCLLLSRR